MSIGATLEGLLFLAFGRLALLPPFAYLVFASFHTLLVAVGILPNTHMQDVLQKKFTAQFYNDTDGSFSASREIVVFLIGTRINHPLGLLAPGWREMAPFFPKMVEQLEANAEEFGFLGMTSWLNWSTRKAQSEILQIGYFKNIDGLHAFAHSKLHREGWAWYEKHSKQYPHLGIFHETYAVPAGNWEAIYKNHHLGGLMSLREPIVDEQGAKVWASPVVEAKYGVLQTMKGRLRKD